MLTTPIRSGNHEPTLRGNRHWIQCGRLMVAIGGAGEVGSTKWLHARLHGSAKTSSNWAIGWPSRALTLAIEAFHLLLRSMGVKDFRACATSAMREAANGPEVVEAIRKRTGVTIDIIRGREEADLIFSNFSIATLDRDRDYVYVDVGGGSTEITLIRQGSGWRRKLHRVVRLLKDKSSPKF